MKLAMAQMRMTDSMDENLRTSLEMCALARGSDLLFFPRSSSRRFFRSMKSAMCQNML